MTRYGPLSLCNLLGLVMLPSAIVLGAPTERPDPGSIPGWDHEGLWRDWFGHLGMSVIGAFAMTLAVIIFAALIISLLRASPTMTARRVTASPRAARPTHSSRANRRGARGCGGDENDTCPGTPKAGRSDDRCRPTTTSNQTVA